jgi:tetratricopeptide (TPR) repeat protein
MATKYDALKLQFDEACQKQTVQEFIKTVTTKNVRSYVTYFFLARAYDFVGQLDKAYEHYLLAIQLISPKDTNAGDIVHEAYLFVDKTGRNDIHDLIVKRRLPGAKADSKPAQKPKSAQKPKVTTPKPAPTPKATTPKPSPTPKATTPKPLPTPKATTPKPLPTPKATTPKPAQTPKATTPKPAQTPKATTPKPAPTPKATTPKPAPTPKATTPKPAPKQTKTSPEQAFSDGKLAFNNNDLKKALDLFAYAYDSGLRSHKLIHKLAMTLQRLKKYEEAIFYLDKGIEQAQNADERVLFLNLKAQIHSSQQQWGKAISAYEELLRFQVSKERVKNRRFTLMRLIVIYKKLGQLPEVERVLNQLLIEFPQDPQAIQLVLKLQNISPEDAFTEGKLAFANKELDKARELLEYAYDAELRSVQLIYILAMTFHRLNKYEEALFYLDTGLELYQNPDDHKLLVNLKAQIHSSKQQDSDAPMPMGMLDEPVAISRQIPQNDDDKLVNIHLMTEEIMDMIFAINETSANHDAPMIFTPTNSDVVIYRYLKTPARNREAFTHFALNLYLLIFERTIKKINSRPQKLRLLPPEFQRPHLFVREVDAIRHAYGSAHITKPEIWQAGTDSIPVSDVLMRYLGSKMSPQDSQFIDLQYGLVESLRDYLNDLYQHIAQNEYTK